MTKKEDQFSNRNQEEEEKTANNLDQSEPEDNSTSLFSFNFLNDENSNQSKPKEGTIDK